MAYKSTLLILTHDLDAKGVPNSPKATEKVSSEVLAKMAANVPIDPQSFEFLLKNSIALDNRKVYTHLLKLNRVATRELYFEHKSKPTE